MPRLKIKYVFSKHNGLLSLTNDDTRETRREIREYIEDLKVYGIELTSLCRQKFNIPDRNNILNIALNFIHDEDIVTKLMETRKLPILEIARLSGFKEEEIESYKDYIVAYMLLFGYQKYSNIVRHLSLGTSIDGLSPGEEKNKGLYLMDLGITSIVLTSQGDFRYLDIKYDYSVGEMVTGKESIFSPEKVLRLVFVIASIISILLFSGYMFYQPNKTLHLIAGGPHVEVAYNRIGRITSIKGMNSSGSKVVKNTVFSNKKIDTSLAELLDAGIKADLVDKTDVSLVVLNGEFKEEDFKTNQLMDSLRKYGINLKINFKNGNALFLK